jgi:hypothetical protein
MKIKRKFLSGVYEIRELIGVDTLVLKKVNFQGWRGFNITAMPNDKVVYWSYFRRKANRFLRKQTKNSALRCEFGESIKYKSLKYNYGYSPMEYFLGMVVSLLLIALSIHEENVLYNSIFIIVAIANLVFFVRSQQRVKALTIR